MQNFNISLLSYTSVVRAIIVCLFVFVGYAPGLHAQCDVGEADCVNSPIIGFPYITQMLDFQGDLFGQEIPGCGGNATFHNTTWFRVIPTTSNLEITITPSDCEQGAGGQLGIQAAMYPACNPGAGPVGDIQCDCTSGPVTVGGTVIPGIPYFIMVDGCAGSYCQLDMQLQSGDVQPPPINLGLPDMPTPDVGTPLCPGAVVTFSVPLVEDADIYTWSFPPGVDVISEDCNEATVTWGPNTGDVFVTVSNNTNGASNQGAPLFVDIDTPMADHTAPICLNDNLEYLFWGDGNLYPPGVYDPIVVDGPDCDTIYTLTVVGNEIEALLPIISNPVSCNQNNSLEDPFASYEDGSATITMVNHGGGPYNYQWDNGETGPTATMLPSGVSFCTVTDSRGCMLEVPVTVEEPQFFSFTVNFDPAPSCATSADGESVILAQNGAAPITYVWAFDGGTGAFRDDIPPGLHEVTGTDANGCQFVVFVEAVAAGGAITANELQNSGEACPGANNAVVELEGVGDNPPFTFTWQNDNLVTNIRSDLSAGSYDVIITDDSGCEGAYTVVVTGGTPIAIDDLTENGVSCFGDTDGSVSFMASGGVAPLVFDANAGSVGGSSITGLAAGDYELTVTDGASCTTAIPFSIPGPDEFMPTIANTPVSCGGSDDGTATVTPVGGTGPYSYAWDYNGETTQTITNLSGGMYEVTVTDANSCSDVLMTEIDGGGSLVVEYTVTPPTCHDGNDGMIVATTIGASGMVAYQWNAVTGTNTIDNLAAGDYELYVEDGLGCNNTLTIPVLEPDTLVVSEVMVDNQATSCNGGNDGQATVTVVGGTVTGDYTYLWSSGETTATATQLVPGVNTVVVTDDNMCSATIDITIAEPDDITADAVASSVECNGEDNGGFTVTANGGDGNYLYSIDNGATSQLSNVFTGLAAGNYDVLITDGNDCQATIPVEVTEPQPLSGMISATNVSCFNAGDGTATLTPSGGVAPYTVTWSGSTFEGETITGLNGGLIIGTVTDANNCSVDSPITVEENSQLLIQVDNQTVASCDGSGGATAAITVIGGEGPYNYNWSAGTSQGDGSAVAGLDIGDVTVIVTDAANCDVSETITIEAPAQISIEQDMVQNVACFGESTGALSVNVTGGSGNSTITWTLPGGGQTTGASLTNIPAGTYSGLVEDANGCTDQIAITISQNPQLVASADNGAVSCAGDSNGQITVDASGGDDNLSYTWNGNTQASNIFNNVPPGNQTITIADGTGCSIVIDVDIIEPLPIQASIAGDNISCNGANDGTATIAANGGTGALQYFWDNSPISAGNSIAGLSAGPHTALVVDENGCSFPLSIDIMEPGAIDIVLDAQTDISCFGANDGTATVAASGGSGMLTYNWDNGSGPTATSLTPGLHTVVVTDNNNCSNTFEVNIAEPTELIITEISTTAVSCNGESNGMAEVSVVGGDGNYTITWPNGDVGTNTTATGLNAGNQTVTVIDGMMCTDEVIINIAEPAPIDATADVVDATCFNTPTGEVTINVNGGTEPYQYILNSAPQASSVFTGLAAGSGMVTVQDNAGCTFDVPFTVDQPLALTSTINAAQVSCFGAGDGSATVAPTGGTPPYNVTWNNGAATGETINGLNGGIAEAVITDMMGCIFTIDAMVDEPAAINIVEIDNQAVLCNNENQGLSTVEATGGTGLLTYTWDNAFGPTADQLTAGMHTVVVTDAQGCSNSLEIEITQPEILAIQPDVTDINCFGDASGSATVSGVGGVAPYSFQWTGGPASPTYDNLTAGAYEVVITDDNGCTQSLNIPVTQPAELTYSANVVDLVCHNADDGSITLDIQGGMEPYVITMNAGAPTGTQLTDLAAGNYDIQISDDNGCVVNFSETITQPDALEASIVASPTSCFNTVDGSAIATVNGGVGPYTYEWNGGANTDSNLPAGTNTVVITDANLCSITETFEVQSPTEMTYDIAFENVSCFGGTDGLATINVVGGTPGANGYTYEWTNTGQVTNEAIQLTANTYTVVVTDIEGCSIQETFNIAQPNELLITDDMVSQATCGEDNGAVSITVEGGSGDYTFDWSDGNGNGNEVTQLTPGNVSVVVTDENGCMVNATYNVSEPGALSMENTVTNASCLNDTDGSIDLEVMGGNVGAGYIYTWSHDPTLNAPLANGLGAADDYAVTVTDSDGCTISQVFTIEQPAALTATLNATQSSCGGADGTVSLIVEGGNGNYTYLWSNNANNATTQNLTAVGAGIYEVTVTDSENCNIIETIEVTNPDTPALAISGTDVTCFGASTGSIELIITGGAGNETIDWNGADTQYDGLTNPTNLPAGVYDVVVTDGSMCSAQTTFTIGQPAAALAIEEIALNQATCGNANGSVEVNVTGGTGNIQYDWSTGVGSGNTVSQLEPGNVVLVVTDANGCSETATYNVSEPDALQVSNEVLTMVDCNGGTSGAINITVEGGNPPYMFDWGPQGNNEDLSNLVAGTYNLVITDNDGCPFNYSATITQPEQLTATSVALLANCGESNGGINVTVNGGTAPFTYQWSDNAGNISSEEDLNGVPANSYTLLITDVNQCQFTITDEVENPNSPSIVATATDVQCFGTATGAVNMDITGGSGSFNYDWDFDGADGLEDPDNLPVGTWTVTVTDIQNCSATETFVINEPSVLQITEDEIIPATCGNSNGSVGVTVSGGTTPYAFNWSNGSQTEDLQSLTPGVYVLNVIDGNGCEETMDFAVLEPDALLAVLDTQTDVTCPNGNNGAIEVTAQGGTPPYTYAWNGGATTDDIDNLPAGSYTLTLTDADLCEVTLDVVIGQPQDISIDGMSTDAQCGEMDGSIAVNVQGGTAPYTYAWDGGAAPTNNPTGLAAGLYNLIVTDANGCNADYSIAVSTPNQLEAIAEFTDVSCFGGSDGSITLAVEGGVAPYTIDWENDDYDGNTSANDLAAGSYTILVIDSEGCEFPVPITLGEPTLLEAFAINPQSSTLCNGSADGSIEIEVNGGTAPYSFQWNNGAGNMQNPSSLTAGEYEVIVTDENGCTASEMATIVEPDAIALTAEPLPASCSNTEDGSIDVTVVGGTGSYTYDWNNGTADTEDLTGAIAGNYTLIVTDQNNCTETISATVTSPDPVVVSLADISDLNGFNTSCNETTDGFLTVSAAGGNTSYTYLWADSTAGPTLSQLGAGSYTVVATDQEGCTGQNSFAIVSPPAMVLDAASDAPDCYGENNGMVVINGVEGGNAPYQYSFNNNTFSNSQFYGNLAAGTYPVAVQDANGCETESEVVVDQVEEIIVNLGNDTTLVLGDSLILSPQFNIPITDSSYVWSIPLRGDTLRGIREVVRPFNTALYSIEVTDEFGCKGYDEILVTVEKPRRVFIPNVINRESNDGNDRLMVYGGQDVSHVRRMEIFNRWGELVFRNNNFPTDTPSNGWDGSLRGQRVPIGVYIYLIEVVFIDGHTELYSGDVTVLN